MSLNSDLERRYEEYLAEVMEVHHARGVAVAVIDRAGRIQIPQEHVIRLGLKDRVRILGEEDHITVRRGEDR